MNQAEVRPLPAGAHRRADIPTLAVREAVDVVQNPLEVGWIVRRDVIEVGPLMFPEEETPVLIDVRSGEINQLISAHA